MRIPIKVQLKFSCKSVINVSVRGQTLITFKMNKYLRAKTCTTTVRKPNRDISLPIRERNTDEVTWETPKNGLQSLFLKHTRTVSVLFCLLNYNQTLESCWRLSKWIITCHQRQECEPDFACVCMCISLSVNKISHEPDRFECNF